MAVPAHDQRDFEFAREHDLPIRIVIRPEGVELDPDAMTEAYAAEGTMTGSGPFDGERSPGSIAKVAAWLDEQGRGRAAVTYRLHDWLVSRQRYWGPPIPIIHCERCGEVAVPEADLPVELPTDVDFRPGGESPLARSASFVHTTCPSCGGEAHRDTDTIDTFVDSSWYFLRFCSPRDEHAAFDPDRVAAWMPVAQYTGGVEHAILHLLYARFVTKVLHDMGLVGFVEPFPRLMNQGQVIYGGASMSKSKGNIVEPMPLVERWGADSMRLLMLFAGPFDDDIDWKLIAGDPDRRPGVTSWLARVHEAVFEAAERGGDAPEPDGLVRQTQRAIKGVTEDLERFRFNTAISKLQVLSNEMRTALDGGGGALDAARALTLMLAPLAPYEAEELWRIALGNAQSVHLASWPSFDASLAAEERVTLVVQVDGKVRDTIEVEAGAGEERIRELASASANATRAIGEREIARVIAKPPKLVNIVTKR